MELKEVITVASDIRINVCSELTTIVEILHGVKNTNFIFN
jgi:hypothetical protein